MPVVEGWQFTLYLLDTLIIIFFMLHGLVKGCLTCCSEEDQEISRCCSANRNLEASSQQNNGDTPSAASQLLSTQGASNQIEDSSPPEPAGFIETRFEPMLKHQNYFIFRTLIVFLLVAISGVIFGFAWNSPVAQESATVTTGTTVNIKGAVLAKVYHNSLDEWKVWDPTDIAQPAVESNMFFIATRRVLTKNQTLREDCVQSDVSCRTDSDCVSRFGKIFEEKGIYTGACGNEKCTVRAWCPLEYNANDANAYVEVLGGSLDFAVLIKSHMYLRFQNGANEKHDSINKYDGNNSANCTYNKKFDPYCPRFNLSSIVHTVTGNETVPYDKLVEHGGVVSIRLDWICAHSECELTYDFTLLHEGNTISVFKGFSSTDSEHDDHTNTRTFIRSTGIVFLIEVDGSGYQRSFMTVIAVFASIIAIVRSADIWSELILIVWLKDCLLKIGALMMMVAIFITFKWVGMNAENATIQYNNSMNRGNG